MHSEDHARDEATTGEARLQEETTTGEARSQQGEAKDPLKAYPAPEIVIGLIGPIGVNLTPVVKALEEILVEVYTVDEIRLSQLIAEFFGVNLEGVAEHERIRRLMLLGTKLRTETTRGDAVALLGVEEIRRLREEDHRSQASRHAYILRSLKTPDEVTTLRNIYGKGFLAISVYAPRETRLAVLAERISSSRHGLSRGARALAERLVEIDELEDQYPRREGEEQEQGHLGQDVQDAFPMGDVFVYTHNTDELRKQVRRFISLVFGQRFLTPTKEEHGMQIAKSAAFRSSDMNRQVGAAIVSDEGDILAVGSNDVPKARGGFYWPDDPGDQRDFRKGRDSMSKHREEVLGEFLARLKEGGLLAKDAPDVVKLVQELISGKRKGVLKGAAGMNMLEFGRSVHAEMAALTTAARLGVTVSGATLYCTTFPCHMCARHIVASGIARVVYVEPYPKSKAKQLHEDAISVDPHTPSTSLVNFEPFQGIAPSRYMELFEASDLRKDSTGLGMVKTWSMSLAQPRFARFMNTYLEIEKSVTGIVLKRFSELEIDATIEIEPEFQENSR